MWENNIIFLYIECGYGKWYGHFRKYLIVKYEFINDLLFLVLEV